MDGLRAAASGLAAQQARMDAIANDIANVSTPGYKKERLAFRDLVDRSGAAATGAGRSFVAGPQIASDNPLALAVEGPGFFERFGDQACRWLVPLVIACGLARSREAASVLSFTRSGVTVAFEVP